MLEPLVGDLTHDIIKYVYKISNKKSNKKRINELLNMVIYMAIEQIQPYLYAIMALLIVMFLINCFQFYYYIAYIVGIGKLTIFETSRNSLSH